ncbi:tetratricopeptide repeat protein [Streptomyces sp. NPDC056672]|uniref:tetratricopeptide repeat protein n=1 Tax=Streptomyces sp. NPDC056672 TaxID=3345906 RepID=UPI00369B4628
MSDVPHQWIRARHQHDRRRLLAAGDEAPVLAVLDAHRRLRGPYSAGGALMRAVVPEALRDWPGLVASHETEILALTPELRGVVPATRETLTSLAVPKERTRFYSRLRTARIAHGLTEFLHGHLSRLGGGPRLLLVDNAHEADPTDQELLAVLLRRADPALLRLRIATAADELNTPPGPLAEPLRPALERYARVITGGETQLPPLPPLSAPDLAARWVDGDCVDDDPRPRAAYEGLAPADRAALHEARADALVAAGEPSLALGAVPYHRERGGDPAGAGAGALRTALDICVDLGFYHATVDFAERGLALVDPITARKDWWAFTTKKTTSLAALGRPEEALVLYEGARAATDSPMVHMQAAYATSMIHTRYLPRDEQDHSTARAWANAAVAFAQAIPDPAERAFQTVFNRNGLALVAVHEGKLDEALALVSEGITWLDRRLEADEHALHRSVLKHNRSQVLIALGRYEEALTDLDDVIAIDSNHAEYHFDRGNLLRRLNRPAEAVVCYERAMALSPPFPEVVYNRADTRLELGDIPGALADFGYAIELDPGRVDAYVNRASLLYATDDPAGAGRDIGAGLELDPDNAPLLCLRGQLLAASDADAAHTALTGLVTVHPDYAPAWAARGAVSYERGELADAIDDFGRSLELEDTPDVRFNRGVAYLETGNPDKALADLSAAFEATGDPEAQLQLGVCLLKLDRPAEARSAFLRCVEEDPALAPRVEAETGLVLDSDSDRYGAGAGAALDVRHG